jgi:hypothetical protein
LIGALHVHEELSGSCSLNDSMTGEDLLLKVKQTHTWDLAGKKLKSVTADGGRNMCGRDTGLVGQICEELRT